MPLVKEEGGTALVGTTNYVAKYTPDGFTLGNSQLFDNGTYVGIGTSTPTALLNVAGSFIVNGKINTNTNIISTSGVDTIDWANCELKFNTSIGLNWYSRLLKDTANNNTLKWSNEVRVKSYLNPVADLMGDDADLRILGDPTGTAGNGLYFKATNSVATWRTTLKILNNGSGEPFVNIIGGDSTSSNNLVGFFGSRIGSLVFGSFLII